MVHAMVNMTEESYREQLRMQQEYGAVLYEKRLKERLGELIPYGYGALGALGCGLDQKTIVGPLARALGDELGVPLRGPLSRGTYPQPGLPVELLPFFPAPMVAFAKAVAVLLVWVGFICLMCSLSK